MKNALRSLRAIKAAIILAKTAEGAGGELKEEDEIKLLQKLVKQRKDSLEIYQKQDRPDLAKKEMEEIEVIEQFLPKQLSPDELKADPFRNYPRIECQFSRRYGQGNGRGHQTTGGKGRWQDHWCHGERIAVKSLMHSRSGELPTEQLIRQTMMIDIVFFAYSWLAVFKGMTRGLIVAIFSLLAVIIGLAAAIKLSAVLPVI